MASLGPGGSFVLAGQAAGYEYNAIVNLLLDTARRCYDAARQSVPEASGRLLAGAARSGDALNPAPARRRRTVRAGRSDGS
jgi:hypothetical protein